MQLSPYLRLKSILESGKYTVDIEKGSIISYGRTWTGRGIGGNIEKKTGYKTARLRYEDKSYVYYVHDIIAAKAGYDLTDKKVIHIDGNKLNNSIDNLKLK